MKRQTTLNYPDTWNESTVNVYERLHSLGRIQQADVDEIEERLQWYRGWRDYFAGTNGHDYTVDDYPIAAGE